MHLKFTGWLVIFDLIDCSKIKNIWHKRVFFSRKEQFPFFKENKEQTGTPGEGYRMLVAKY